LASETASTLHAALALALAGAVTLAVPRSAAAQPAESRPIDDDNRNSARKLGEEGNKLFAAGDFAGALDRYQRAEQLVNVPTLGVRIARCLVKLGRLVEATEKYVQVSRVNLPPDALPQHAEAVEQAKGELAALKPRVPTVTIRIDPPEGPVDVTIDGKPVPPALLGAGRSIDPGRHEVVATRGSKTERATFEIAEGKSEEVTLVLGPAEASTGSAPSTETEDALRITGIALLAAGGGSLVAFGVTGGLGLSKRSDLEASCGEELRCGPALHEDVDAYNQLRLASTITLWVGVGLAAAGTVLVVAAPAATPSGEVKVGFGPGSVVVEGRF
jgi:tetratricopeptide (TPR) repeat protein